MQMNWFCVASRRRTRGRWWDDLLRCVEEDKVNAGKRTECSRKVASGRRVTGAIRLLVNARDL